MRAVVTGGAGFLGSHLVDRLLERGDEVWVIDSLISGRWENIARARDGNCHLIQDDVTEPLSFSYARSPRGVDRVYHLASVASPTDYGRWPLHTLDTGARGTENALQLAQVEGARFLLASTSEVYGDPLEHPQREEYWGNVNPVGPRSCYDEAKRFAEAYATAVAGEDLVDVRIARIHNTYGPRMRATDGRAVPTFVRQALAGEPLTVHGDGRQTRSLCYVDDMVDGLVRLMESEADARPVNLGSSREITVEALAAKIIVLSMSLSEIKHVDRPVDDPGARCPDTRRAWERLGWRARTSLVEGLLKTISWARGNWRSKDADAAV